MSRKADECKPLDPGKDLCVGHSFAMVDDMTGDIGIEFMGPEHRLLSYKPTACQIILPMPGRGLRSFTFQLNLGAFHMMGVRVGVL